MTNVSPLGALKIALFVNSWNSSMNTTKKHVVRKLIESDNPMRVTQALEEMPEMVTDQVNSAEVVERRVLSDTGEVSIG